LGEISEEELIAKIIKSKLLASRFGWISVLGSSMASVLLFSMIFTVGGAASVSISVFLAFAMMREAFVGNRERIHSTSIVSAHEFTIKAKGESGPVST
jgi:hypothetical protein